jgi:hypothetical protein
MVNKLLVQVPPPPLLLAPPRIRTPIVSFGQGASVLGAARCQHKCYDVAVPSAGASEQRVHYEDHLVNALWGNHLWPFSGIIRISQHTLYAKYRGSKVAYKEKISLQQIVKTHRVARLEASKLSLDNRLTDCGGVVSLTCRPPLTPRKIAGNYFF